MGDENDWCGENERSPVIHSWATAACSVSHAHAGVIQCTLFVCWQYCCATGVNFLVRCVGGDA